MKTFGINGDYDEDESSLSIYLSFEKESEDSSLSWALEKYVHALMDKHGEDDGLDIFYQADMHIFSC